MKNQIFFWLFGPVLEPALVPETAANMEMPAVRAGILFFNLNSHR